MSVDQMREAITKVYPAERWQKKVAKMSDDQVMAIYFKFAQHDMLEKKSDKHYIVARRSGKTFGKDYVVKKTFPTATDGYTNRPNGSDGYTVHQISFDELMRQT